MVLAEDNMSGDNDTSDKRGSEDKEKNGNNGEDEKCDGGRHSR